MVMNKILWKKICSIILVICLAVCSLTGCSDKKNITEIEQRIEDFVIKCNELDIDGILRCVDPDKTEFIAWVIKGVEAISQSDKYEIYSALTEILLDEDGIDAAEFFETIRVEIVKTELHGNYAYVYSYISYAVAGIMFTKEGVIEMTEQAGKWYINWLEFVMFD